MRRTVLIIGLCVFAASPVLADLSITTTGNGGTYDGYGIWQTNQGGEFTFRPSGWDPLPYYSGLTRNQGGQENTFQTFCLEHSEYLYGNTTHAVVLNDRMVNGGVGPQGDPLSVGTAWLYHEFQNGTLAGYDYSNTGTGRHTSAQGLQNAIWFLEDEVGGSLSTAYRNMLEAQFGSVTNAKLDNNGRIPVAVMNLYADGHAGDQNYLRQDGLVCTPLPAGALLGFLGLCAAGVKLRRFA
jgi:hypothetical protein